VTVMSGAAVRGGNVVVAKVLEDLVIEEVLLFVVLLSDVWVDEEVDAAVDEDRSDVIDEEKLDVEELESLVDEVRSDVLDEEDSDVEVLVGRMLVVGVVGFDEVVLLIA
jgi:hypothetical protein